MNLVIHDMNEEEWSKIADRFSGCEVISDTGTIKPCVGCFGCWLKNPGQCVMKDGYERMGALIHKADEVVVISRYTYGGFSSFVKNVFDRSIGWVLPYFEVYEGEMHHKKRYPEEKPITFIFRGSAFSADEKRKAKAYVEAVCRNFRGKLKDLKFVKCEPVRRQPAAEEACEPDKIVLLNGSLRGNEANTRVFLSKLSENLTDGELINLSAANPEKMVQSLASAGTIVLGMPLYVDGIPSQVLRVMERLEEISGGREVLGGREASGGREAPVSRKKVYVVANMGLFESHQIKNLLSMVRDWCESCGYAYCGGIAIGAGEMMKMFMSGKGPAKKVVEGLKKLAEAINTSAQIDDIYAGAYMFPRWMYMFAANAGWPKAGKNNGLKRKDLLRKM